MLLEIKLVCDESSVALAPEKSDEGKALGPVRGSA